MLSNFHTHTSRCKHATGNDKEYVEAAIKAGFQTLGFSDHCPWPFPDGYISGIRMTPSEMDGYFSSLDTLKKEYAKDITIYAGFEAEYDSNLNAAQEALFTDYPIDYLILGQHFLGTESEALYTGAPCSDEAVLKHYVDLVIEGISTGKYLYLAHPDVIHFTGPDEIYKKHMTRLCQYLKEQNIPVEINILGLCEHRHYPDTRFLSIAGQVGNTAVIGVDAHSPEQLLNKASIEQAELLCKNYGLERIEPQLSSQSYKQLIPL